MQDAARTSTGSDDPPPTAPGEWEGDGELALPYWLTGTAEAASASFLHMARRLPACCARPGGWPGPPTGGPPCLVSAQLAAGVAGGFGLASVVGVLDGLLRAAPTRTESAPPCRPCWS